MTDTQLCAVLIFGLVAFCSAISFGIGRLTAPVRYIDRDPLFDLRKDEGNVVAVEFRGRVK